MPKLIELATVISQTDLGRGVKALVLHAPQIAAQAAAGQFVHLRVADNLHPLLRRPISIAGADKTQGHLHMIYRIVGQGTSILAQMKPHDRIDCMGPLGNGFMLQGERPLLIGGGMGLAPMLFLAGALCPRPIEILMGGRTKEEMFWPELFSKVCSGIHITTDDGTLGTKGLTIDVLPALLRTGQYDSIYTCGPKPMMERVSYLANELDIPCQVSLEEHMACGVGACLSCTCQTSQGSRKKICTDGPVFWAGEVFGCK